MDILVVAIDPAGEAASRLPEVLGQALGEAGLTVALLCPADQLHDADQLMMRHIDLPPSRSIRRLARTLSEAIADCAPRFVIPGDAHALALLHSLVRGRHAALVSERVRGLILRSLGNHSQFDTMLSAARTQALARKLGIAVPSGVGGPWHESGRHGDDRCATSPRRRAWRLRIAAAIRHMRGHGWCPTAAPADGPGVVAGEPVVFCALAWQGRMIAGFAGTKLQSVAANGPGVAVRIGHDPRLVAAAEKMIAALGCAGLVSFEFRVEPGSGSPVLIACCPRPIPLGILGARIGADLAAELAALLRGAPTRAQPVIPTGHAELLLFPPALHVARRRSIFFADVPRQGPSVTHHVARARDREQRQRVWA